MAGPEGLAHRVPVGGQEEVRAEGVEVAVAVHAAREHRPPDVEPVPGDRVEHPEPGVHAVAREEDHVHPPPQGLELVQGEKLSHRGERGALAERLRLAGRLVAGVGLHPVAGEHPVALLEVEERPRRDGDGEDGGRGLDPVEEERQPRGNRRTRPPGAAAERGRRRRGTPPIRPWTCKGKKVHGRHYRGLVAHGVSLVNTKLAASPRRVRPRLRLRFSAVQPLPLHGLAFRGSRANPDLPHRTHPDRQRSPS